MTTLPTPDLADREEIEALHDRFCGRQGDAAIELQDRSYELGRKRGRADCAELLEALKQIAAIEDKLVGNDWEEIEEARTIARAAIAKATGGETV